MERFLYQLLRFVAQDEEETQLYYDVSFDIFGHVVRDGDLIILRDPYRLYDGAPLEDMADEGRTMTHVVEMAEGCNVRRVEGEVYVGAADIVTVKAARVWAKRWRDLAERRRVERRPVMTQLIQQRLCSSALAMRHVARFLGLRPKDVGHVLGASAPPRAVVVRGGPCPSWARQSCATEHTRCY